MSNVDSTPAFPYALSPLCQIPMADSPISFHVIDAADTLIRASQALAALYQNTSDEDYGRALLLETIDRAMQHAIALLQTPDK